MPDINIIFSAALSAHFYSIFCFAFIVFAAFSSTYIAYQKPDLDRVVFWAFGLGLIGFTFLRPLPLSRDDAAYIQIAQSICSIGDCGLSIQGLRDWGWYLAMSFLKSFFSNEQSLMALASIGVAIKLLIIDQLCKHRLLALVLLIPLTYIQYDFTQLRAGFAISWYFLAIFFLYRYKDWIAGSLLVSNFALHAQAAPSIGLIPFTWLNQRQWVLPITVVGFLVLIYTGLFPSFELMQQLHIAKSGAGAYLAMNASGEYINVKIFPLGYLPILAFGLWLCWGDNPQKDRLSRIIGASILLAIFLAWLFSFNPTIQTRMFEFYIAPLVLLAGNIGSNKAKLFGTLVLSGILYLRLEWLHDWILG
jgi:hypothetical protein